MDDDDVWLPDKLEEQLKIFKRYPDVGLVYGKYKHMGNGKIIPPKIIEGNVFESLLRDNSIGTSTVIIRKRFSNLLEDLKRVSISVKTGTIG